MCGSASAETVLAGVWSQTSSTAGDCPSCEIDITTLTPNIIALKGNNQWLGFAFYDKMGDVYRGALEWKAGEGEALANTVFEIELHYSGGTLSMAAQSVRGSINATYTRKENSPVEESSPVEENYPVGVPRH